MKMTIKHLLVAITIACGLATLPACDSNYETTPPSSTTTPDATDGSDDPGFSLDVDVGGPDGVNVNVGESAEEKSGSKVDVEVGKGIDVEVKGEKKEH